MAEETPVPDAPKSDHDTLQEVVDQLRHATRTDNQETITITLPAEDADAMADALEAILHKMPGQGRAQAKNAPATPEAEKK